MKTLLIAGSAALALAGAARAQEPAAPQGGPWTDAPILSGATASPDCGDLHNLNGRAFCVTAPLGQMGALADAYVSTLEAQGWVVADGSANRVVFIKRTGENACDAVQMIAFYDTSKPAIPEAAAWLGFATIPGNVCATAPAAPAQ